MKITELKLNKANPRFIRDEKFKKLVKSIKEFPAMMELRPIVYDTDGTILGGNMRYRAICELGMKEIPDTWAKRADTLTDEEKRRFIIEDNVAFGEWNVDDLANEWDAEELKDWGVELPIDLGGTKEERQDEARKKLTEKFIVPPFSVLDTRQGYWQERKKYWKELIGDNGESREHTDIFNQSHWDNKPYKGGIIRENSVSILDPVLSELVNLWFGLPNCKMFDCFAGDSVFGYVSSYLGNKFTGIELRKEQTDLNNERVKEFQSTYICDDGQNVLNHIEENSQDLLFSCPPYFDLEVYSDLPNDASNQKEYSEFLKILDNAFTNSLKCLKNNRFAVLVVGEVRDKKGFYYRFVDHIKDIFTNNGALFYNEMILIQSTGNAALRANAYMKNRKVVKLHEEVLVFFKGDPKQIKNIYPKIEVNASEDLELSGMD